MPSVGTSVAVAAMPSTTAKRMTKESTSAGNRHRGGEDSQDLLAAAKRIDRTAWAPCEARQAATRGESATAISRQDQAGLPNSAAIEMPVTERSMISTRAGRDRITAIRRRESEQRERARPRQSAAAPFISGSSTGAIAKPCQAACGFEAGDAGPGSSHRAGHKSSPPRTGAEQATREGRPSPSAR